MWSRETRSCDPEMRRALSSLYPAVSRFWAQDVRKSRVIYMEAKKRAIENPESLLVIAIDGSDQSSYGIPYFCQETKNTAKGYKMRMKLIGALVTGRLMHFCTLGSNWECGEDIRERVGEMNPFGQP